MRKIFLILLVLFFPIISCDDVEIVNPTFPDKSILEGTSSIPMEIKRSLEGIYLITTAKKLFGQRAVLKFNGETLSFFGEKLGVYFIMETGMTEDSTLLFEGRWRYAQGTDVGLVRLSVAANNSGYILSGNYSEGDGLLDYKITLEFERKFSESVLLKEFLIFAHRGGGRNSDYLGVSENSVEITSLAGKLGANGIEVDVKLSKDNVPFLYHDISINLRATKDSPLWGPIEDFSFAQIRSFIKLVNGERIPSLEEVLLNVLNNTDLKFVWLDMKSERNSMPYVIPIVQDILTKAENIERELEIFIGLPDDFMRDNFLSYPAHSDVAALCELTMEDVRLTDAKIWAPRWTLGLQSDAIEKMHSENRRVVTWTLDQAGFIENFIKNGKFDGILTNYPTLVAYYYYVQ